MYKFTAEADSDIAAIDNYSAAEFGERQAEVYSASLRSACQRIADFPKLGRLCQEIAVGLRRHDCNEHVIFYQEVGLDVLIIRILHKQMDHARHLDG